MSSYYSQTMSCGVIFVSFIDIFIVVVLQSQVYDFTWFSAFTRPLYVILQTRVLREYWIKYFLVMKDSMPMMLFILVSVLYFSWMFQRFFSGTLEGVQFFGSFGNSFFNMIVLMTTTNFPDVMLPAYQISRLYFIFFFFYLFIVLLLLMNLLLAIFYSNFKTRFKQGLDEVEDKRNDYFLKQFIGFGGKKGYLNETETYRMFLKIHGLVTGINYDMDDEQIEQELNFPQSPLLTSQTQNEKNIDKKQ